MSTTKIICPKCKHAFEPTDALKEQIQSDLESKFEAQKADLQREFETKAKQRERDIKAKATEEARAEGDLVRRDLETALEESKKRAKEAGEKELSLRQQTRELEAAKSDFELQMARKLDEERERIRPEASEKVSEEHALKESDWKRKQEDMEKLIEDLKRRAESTQSQSTGESFELKVEETLSEAFKYDEIVPVEKGVSGADVALRVRTRDGKQCGIILFELKRTKSFSPAWLPKLRDDQRAAKADVAILITTVLPEGIKHIGQLDGIWISDPASFLGLAQALRASLLELAQAKAAQAGRKEKAVVVYEYLNGVEFRGRVEALVESFVSMREGIESERRAFEKIWSRREKELTRAMTSTAGMYGDLQGLIGTSLQEIPQLCLEQK